MELPSTLVLVLCFLSCSAQQLDYSPCYYNPSYNNDNGGQIICDGQVASEALDAFRRNKNNSNIDALYLWNMNNMTASILTEIMDIVAATASEKVWRIELENLQKVKKVPRALKQFNNLQHFHFKRIGGLRVLPAGSMAISSDNLFHLYCDNNPDLNIIKPDAFQGNFNGTNIHLSDNNLNHFDEAVFMPLFTDSTVRIEIEGNPIKCDSCKLAWIIRDNRQYLSRVVGDCNDKNGGKISFNNVDPDTLSNC